MGLLPLAPSWTCITETVHIVHSRWCLPARRKKRSVPQALRDLVERCWAADYDTRPDFKDVITTLGGILNGMPLDTPISDPSASGSAANSSACCSVQ